MWFFTLITKALGFFSGVNVGALINGVTDVIKNRTNAEVADHASDNQSGVALGTAYLRGIDATNQIKLENKRIEGAWGPTTIVGLVLFVSPYGFHSAAIVFDSMPFFGHVVGSWGIARLPGLFEETEHMVIRSLFYVSGGVGAISMLAKAFGKR